MNFLLAAIAVLGVAASGPIMAATAAPALAIAFWRNAIGAVVMGVPTAVRKPASYGALKLRDLLWPAVAALGLALHFACFVTSLKLTSVAASTGLVCLQSGWIVVFQLARRQKLAPAILIGLVLALAGAFVITGFDVGNSPEAPLGDVLALAGGALAAAYTLAGAKARKARQNLSTGVYTSLCYGMCALWLVVLALIFSVPLLDFPPVAWLGILGVTLVAQLLGHTIFNFLLSRITPLVISLLILLEIPGLPCSPQFSCGSVCLKAPIWGWA